MNILKPIDLDVLPARSVLKKNYLTRRIIEATLIKFLSVMFLILVCPN